MYHCIVVGTDGSDTAAEAVRHAADLARTFSAPLHLVSAYGTDPTPEAELAPVELGEWIAELSGRVEAMLADAAKQLTADGLDVKTHAVFGHPVNAIVSTALAEGADLVVVGNVGMQAPARTIGSVPNSIAHRAPCNVLVVHTT
jgi:nucleotide-binding universal stress UspA family protein